MLPQCRYEVIRAFQNGEAGSCHRVAPVGIPPEQVESVPSRTRQSFQPAIAIKKPPPRDALVVPEVSYPLILHLLMRRFFAPVRIEDRQPDHDHAQVRGGWLGQQSIVRPPGAADTFVSGRGNQQDQTRNTLRGVKEFL